MDEEGDLHVIPCHPMDPVHEEDGGCWCEPELIDFDDESCTGIYKHRTVH